MERWMGAWCVVVSERGATEIDADRNEAQKWPAARFITLEWSNIRENRVRLVPPRHYSLSLPLCVHLPDTICGDKRKVSFFLFLFSDRFHVWTPFRYIRLIFFFNRKKRKCSCKMCIRYYWYAVLTVFCHSIAVATHTKIVRCFVISLIYILDMLQKW